MQKTFSVLAAAVAAVGCSALTAFAQDAGATKLFRAPAAPLVTHDPYLSIWSEADKLTDRPTKHWTNDPNRNDPANEKERMEAMRLNGLIRVDGETFRVLGDAPAGTQAMNQTGTQITPTRTICTFESPKVKLTLTFLTPALPSDITLLSTPITYVIWDVTSADGQAHDVSAFFGATGDLARNDRSQKLAISPSAGGEVPIVKVGTVAQPTLARAGDGTRIDWGYACLGGNDQGVKLGTATNGQFLETFAKTGDLASGDASAADNNPNGFDAVPSLGATISFGSVSGTAPVTRHILVGYDDDKAIEWMGSWLNAYWKKDGKTIEQAFADAEKNMADVKSRCEKFDADLTASLTQVGGAKYAQIAALAHRQSLAGAKVVADANGAPLMFSKENTSNGCIGTVDVFFPQSPQLLLLNNDLAKATVTPILKYASSPRWRFPFAPHDLGTYPHADGQVYGDGERGENGQMPVEESGNMLLILGGISKVDGNADFAKPYWPILQKWAQYLEKNGVDPATQLCTDDFAGHIARNANLSVKAILAMAAYSQMAEMLGQHEEAQHFMEFAKQSAQKWMQLDDAGDHYGLVFEKPNTWSQKYNLVWQQVLDVDVFPQSVIDKELAFYKTKMQPFGLPLDSRELYTKSDWELWTATLALGDHPDVFNTIVDGVYNFADQTDKRQPFSDWYYTNNAKVRGFIARPVIGGIFMPMLKDQKVWLDWAHKATPLQNVQWADLPVPPKLIPVVATSQDEPQTWRYTTDKPADGWQAADFADNGWKQGPGGFGTRGTPGASVRTVWNTGDIWLRREITIPNNLPADAKLQLIAYHDEDMQVFLDGEQIAQANGFVAQYQAVRMTDASAAKLTPGKHTIAVHCHQETGGQYIDVGVVRVEQPK